MARSNKTDWTGIDRRETDVVLGVLSERLDAMERYSADVAESLKKHVQECATTQKRVLLICIGIFGWLVGHSPEVGRAIISISKVVVP